MLFWKRRRLFFKVIPVIALVFVAYVGAFWNSTSSSGFPAQAVKSVIAPTEISDRNQSSDAYRIAENLDLHYTIQTSKVFGIGLGKAFLRPYPLPDLGTNFAYTPYIPHNSFLWVWASMGIGGFASMIYLIGRAISLGAAKVRAAPLGQDLVVLVTFVLAVVVFVVYCYVDIAWDAGNMTMLGVAVAVCSGYPVHELRRDEDDSPPASEHHDLVASTPVGVR